MSGEIVKFQEDFTSEENELLSSYKKRGLPGITKVDESKTFEWFQLYMAGKGYGEIAAICNTPKEVVLYMGDKLGWHAKKMNYYNDINTTLISKTMAARVESASTVAGIISAFNHYLNDKFNNYLRTKDPKYIEGFDTKMLQQYYKSVEILDKLIGADNKKESAPPVNINLSSSNTNVQQEKDGSVTITDNSAKDLLSALAKYKKRISEEEDA